MEKANCKSTAKEISVVVGKTKVTCVSVIVGRRSPDYRFDEPFLPIDGSIRLGRPKYIYAWATLGQHLGQLGANLTTLRQLSCPFYHDGSIRLGRTKYICMDNTRAALGTT